MTRLQDKRPIKKMEALIKDSITDHYEQRMPKDLQQLTQKLKQSELDVLSGNVHSQDSVKNYLKK